MNPNLKLMKPSHTKATVLGAGSWGTALATVLAHHFSEVALWGRDSVSIDKINTEHKNTRYLPDLDLAENICGTTSLTKSVEDTQVVVNALPTSVISDIFSQLAQNLPETVPVINSSKGLCKDTLQFPVEMIHTALKRKTADEIYVLSGPSFAKETVQKQATTVTVAGTDTTRAEDVGKLFFTPWFRTYPSTDVIGVEIAGALKNVLAIAAGMCDGLGLGMNTQAALITRGLAEMSRMGSTLGADPLTFLGLAGMGDLILTCTGGLSRNRSFGKLLSQGLDASGAQKKLGQTVEGYHTTKSLRTLMKQKKLDMPIATEIYNIIFEQKGAEQALIDLMSRPMRAEHA